MKQFYHNLQKAIFLIAFFTFHSLIANAQTLTLGAVDAGPYTPGSSIAVPFTVNTSSGCIKPDNVFNLYISSVPGGTPDRLIGTYSSFYAAFLNGTIPTGLTPGSYNLAVKSTDPVITSATASINVVAGAIVQAAIDGASINSDNPEIFGNCSGTNAPYDFFNASTSGATVTANFHNEYDQSNGGTVTLNPSASFTAGFSNYTILVKATNYGTVATKAYQLINNNLNTNFGTTGSNTVCLSAGHGQLSYTVDYTSANGIQYNYPGNLYIVNWGDGSTTIYSLCDIIALNGRLTHDYTQSSCGSSSGGQINSFQVDAQVSSRICGTLGSPITSYARVVRPPTNGFTSPLSACLNEPVTFNNTSDPGQDASSTNCVNNNAKYSWYIDGVLQAVNRPGSASFTYTFTTPGNHTVKLVLQSQSGSVCTATDLLKTICVLAKPQPAFALSSSTICSNAILSISDQSITDQSCSNIPQNNAYAWGVTGPGATTFVGGTTSSSHQPQIQFFTPGIYTITLSISTESCGAVTTSQTLIVNTAPTVSLSPDKTYCGTNQTLTFDANAGATQTLFTGTTADQPNTYNWTIMGGNYSFQNNTNANSKYPTILFTDFAVYTVTATQTNNCGTASATQHLEFKQSPTVSAGPDQAICPSDVVHLAGTITGPAPQSYDWTGGAGTFSPGRNSLTATYTPTNAEISAGRVTLTLHAATGNPSPCDQIYDDVVITIFPQNQGTDATASICTGTNVNFQPTSSVAGSTFTWTSTANNATRTTASGSGNINDLLTNTDGLNNGTVTYTIMPMANNCQGTPFTLTVTVTPRPVITVNNTSNTICSGQPTGIAFTSNITGTLFKWTTSASPGIYSNSSQAQPVVASRIDDVLTNTSATTAGTATYQITPIGPTGCPGAPVTVTITVQPLPIVANAGPDQQVCNSTSYILNGNDPGVSSGMWTITSGQTGTSFANAAQYNTLVNGLVAGQQYTFRWTITGSPQCSLTSDDVVISDLADLTNNIGFANPAVCYGQTITISGDQPTGGNNSYIYSWQSSSDNASWTAIAGQNGRDYSFTATANIYLRRIVISGPCTKISNSVLVVVQASITNNTINADQSICYNNTPSYLNGSMPGGADGNYNYQWQSSTGSSWLNISGANGITYQPGALTGSTQFRRIVTTAACNGAQQSVSNVVSITVSPRNTNTITSAPTKTICTGTTLSYQPTAQATAGTVFTWTSAASTSVTGNTASGTGNINDALNNSDPNNNGTVTYTIIPVNNNCPGTPFTLTVTVTPIPQVILTSTGNQICSGNPTGITFNTNIPGAFVKWTFDAVAGVSGSNNQFPVIATGINDVLSSTLTTPATIVYHITPISANGCVGPTVDATVTVLPQPVTANAGADEAICNSVNYTLKGNDPSPSTGRWSIVSGQTTVGFADATRYNTSVTGLLPGQNYTFRWTITPAGACSTSIDDVVIADLTSLTNTISFANPAVCYGQTITISGDNPTGGNGSYVYTWQSSTDNANWTAISNASGANLSFAATQTIYVRRIVTSGPCVNISQPVQIIVQQAITANTIGSDQEVCYNNTPKLLTGSTPAGADGNYFYQWQKSEDNGVNWTNLSGANTINYQVNSLIVTTQFRRVVTTLLCSGPQQSISNVITVMVNPLPNPTYTYTGDVGCIPYVLDANNIKATAADGNATYTWYADGVQIGNGLTFPGYTITDDNTQVVIKLVVTSKYGCLDASFTHTFSTKKEVAASFTQDLTKGCGPLTVTFNNTSNPQNLATYTWNFGNGVTSTLTNPAPVTFLPRTNGKDTTYTVTLKALTACGIRTITSTVTVRPKPISIFTPDQTVGCSPFKVNFNNTSPGTNNTYTFDFGDGQTLVTHDNQNVIHTYISQVSKTYTVKMTAENECGKSVSQYNIRISPNSVLPQLVVNGDQKAGCAPWTVQFYNNTKGGTYFTYNFGDGTTVSTLTAPEVVTHTFLKDGTYNVKLTATNGCADTSAYQSIIVYPQPVTKFTSDVQKGCNQLTVNFKNQTSGNNTYTWDFGDGSTDVTANPQHTFAARSTPFTVTLIAKNALGCMDTMVMKNYINVVPVPKAVFAAKPDSVIVYPYYSFDFADHSTANPILWKWDFGDGTGASKQNPGHTYRDTGLYKVKLIVYNLQGCADSVTHHVRITGVPGQLFVPNAFMPTSKFDEVVTFKVKGSGLKTWRFRIFNKWGQVIWETTKLNDRGEPAEGWDGMMGGAPAPQGVYVWQIEGKYINGKDWTGMSYNHGPPSRQGVIHLIR